MLAGSNVHPWTDFNGAVDFIAATPGMKVVRWDVQTLTTPIPYAVEKYDYAKAKGLESIIVAVQPPDDFNATFKFVQALAREMGPSRAPILEICNEPNAPVGGSWGHGWKPADYYQALYAARNALTQTKQTNVRLSMGGLALNDQPWLAASGIPGSPWLTDFGNLHAYTYSLGDPKYGPLAPDDLDVLGQGRLSMLKGIEQMQKAVPKPLIIGEWGWRVGELPDSQRASYVRAAVSLARCRSVYAMILGVVGDGDGQDANMQRSPSVWQAFAEAIR